MELREKLGEIARHVRQNCTIEQFLKEMANAILDCYNSISDKVFKYVGSVMVEREHQNSDLNKRIEEVRSQLLDVQQEITRKENLVKEKEIRIAEINQQLDGFKNQLLETQQEKLLQENLIQERDTKIAEIQQHFDDLRNQLLNFQEQKTLQENVYGNKTYNCRITAATRRGPKSTFKCSTAENCPGKCGTSTS